MPDIDLNFCLLFHVGLFLIIVKRRSVCEWSVNCKGSNC